MHPISTYTEWKMASLSLYVLKSTDMECLMADHQCTQVLWIR